MNVNIYCRDEIPRFGRASKGKNTVFSSDEFAITTNSKRLLVTGSRVYMSGTADRGGHLKPIAHTLTLELAPADLKRLLDAALASKLLEASFTIPAKKPKTKRRLARNDRNA